MNDIRGLHVTREHVIAAITGAKTGPVDEGAVGAGTGTVAFGWKGGIGTSSRTVRQGGGSNDTWTVGVLVQSNYGGKLVIDGVPCVEGAASRCSNRPAQYRNRHSTNPAGTGRRMIVVATDAPLDARDLRRLAARAIFGLARTGSTYSNGSGDFAIAFSTHPSLRVTSAAGPQTRTVLPTDGVSGLFERGHSRLHRGEAVDPSACCQQTDVTANGRTHPGDSRDDALKALLKKLRPVTVSLSSGARERAIAF